MEKTIDLTELEVDIEYTYEPASIGEVDESGRKEHIPACVSIHSVKAKPRKKSVLLGDVADVEIYYLLTPAQIESLEEEILEGCQ
jgi:hypothetical protein